MEQTDVRAEAPRRIALSVRQPWAWALLFGGKDVENRTWSTRHRGRIWIHASKREIADDVDYAVQLVAKGWNCEPDRALEHYREHDPARGHPRLAEPHRMPPHRRSAHQRPAARQPLGTGPLALAP